MREGIKQEVCGHIQPLRLNKDTVPGNILPLINWGLIAQLHQPSNSANYIFKGQLEYLHCDYFIDSLNKVDSKQLPDINELVDSNLQKQAKYYEFKRKYSVEKRYVIELMLHTKWGATEWGAPKAGEFLYSLGQYGYINLFDPYLLRDSEILYSDSSYQVGVSTDGYFGDFDRAEINGGYSGVISYFEVEQTESLSENSGGVEIGASPVQVLGSRLSRRFLYLCNEGNSRVYFCFANTSAGVTTNAPFLEPGESLTIEFDKAFWSGGGSHHWIAGATKYYLTQRLYCIRKANLEKVTFQEFY
ncbi:MAG: hypothetical protein WBA93_20135 [Microcoleaceae cyanobacterium]